MTSIPLRCPDKTCFDPIQKDRKALFDHLFDKHGSTHVVEMLIEMQEETIPISKVKAAITRYQTIHDLCNDFWGRDMYMTIIEELQDLLKPK